MTLHLILKTCWYNMITQGIKREEYRENKPYWKKRLFSHQYTHVCFHRAYTNETMTYKIESISIGRGRAEWGAYEITSNPPNRTIWFVDAQLWFADAAFCISNTQHLLKIASISTHFFQNPCTIQINVLPLQQQFLPRLFLECVPRQDFVFL